MSNSSPNPITDVQHLLRRRQRPEQRGVQWDEGGGGDAPRGKCRRQGDEGADEAPGLERRFELPLSPAPNPTANTSIADVAGLLKDDGAQHLRLAQLNRLAGGCSRRCQALTCWVEAVRTWRAGHGSWSSL
ncbi:uncharacterized protein A4U43_C01F7900 [Asparagus officinalis]|uniref:Uncharacterized protein n=1 Tax=Asparagus officinalis TaxID=4686 RepID=A0A5P1FMY3_ASPOF|nr:uncharacterized protein A4U43_C01F7900 [Asparagus officinalis]